MKRTGVLLLGTPEFYISVIIESELLASPKKSGSEFSRMDFWLDITFSLMLVLCLQGDKATSIFFLTIGDLSRVTGVAYRGCDSPSPLKTSMM